MSPIRNCSGWLGFLGLVAGVTMVWGVEDVVTLKVGDPAPKLFVSKWLNGDAVNSFEKNQIYALECWATWCGPCRASIPHVSELNTKFKDKGVVIIGMNVWERSIEGVEAFVKEMGEKMNYRVAIDEPPGKTADAWLKASGHDGIPCAFVVDKEGKIAWIGHPMEGMERVIQELVIGTFDRKKEAELAAKQGDLRRRFQEAVEADDVDKLLALADEALILDPGAAAGVGMMKFQILLTQKRDYPAAYSLASKLLENELKDNADALNGIAWIIVDTEGIEKRDLDLALKAAIRADELSNHENAPILDTLARVYFEKGQVAKAVEVQKLAVGKAEEGEMKNDLKATLEMYKEKNK